MTFTLTENSEEELTQVEITGLFDMNNNLGDYLLGDVLLNADGKVVFYYEGTRMIHDLMPRKITGLFNKDNNLVDYLL